MDNNANVGAAKRKVEAALEHAEEQLENLKQQMQMVSKRSLFWPLHMLVCCRLNKRRLKRRRTMCIWTPKLRNSMTHTLS